jgi:preprotein translocase subunit SecB
MDTTKQPGLRVNQIFIRAVSFEHREDALSLPPSTSVGETTVSISMQHGIAEGGAAGFVAIRVASDNEKNPLYRFDLEMTALISEEESAKNLPVEEYLKKHGPGLLFPFVREALASITARGRFGAIYLRPFNLRMGTEETPKPQEQEKPPEELQTPQG